MTAPAKPRKTAAKVKRSPKAAPVAPVAAPAAEEIEGESPVDGVKPVVIVRGRRADPQVEQVKIFELDGVAYTIPREPSPALVLKYLFDMHQVGRDVAMESMAVTFLGERNFTALASGPGVTKDQVMDVFANVSIVFFGSATYEDIFGAAGN